MVLLFVLYIIVLQPPVFKRGLLCYCQSNIFLSNRYKYSLFARSLSYTLLKSVWLTHEKSWIFIGRRAPERCVEICECLRCLDGDRARGNSRFAHQRSCAQCHAQISGMKWIFAKNSIIAQITENGMWDLHQLFAKPIPITHVLLHTFHIK